MLNVKSILAAAAVAAISFGAQAATLNLVPVVEHFWADGVDPLVGPESTPVLAGGKYGSKGIYQIALKMQIGDTAGQSFAQLAFDLNAVGNLTQYNDAVNAINSLTSTNPKLNAAGTKGVYTDPFLGDIAFGSGAGASSVGIVTDFGDTGTSTSDMKFIYLEASVGGAIASNSPKRLFGQTGQNAALTGALGLPVTFANLLMKYDGGDAALTGSFGLPGEGLTLVNGDSGTLGQPSVSGATFGSVQFGEIPEPATLSLAAIGGLGLIRRRRA